MENHGLPTFEDLRPQFLKAPLHLWVPDGLMDFQVGWFVNLLRASLKSDLLGYLPLCAQRDCKNCPSCLWRVAGARNQGFFEKESPVVKAAFEPSQIAGRRVLYFPPLIRCLAEQQKRLRSKSKSVSSGDLFSETCASFPQKGPRSSPSSSPSEVVSEVQNLTTSNTREGLIMTKRGPLETFEIEEAAKRILRIMGLPDGLLSAAMAAVTIEANQTELSMDGVVQHITDAANHSRRRGISEENFLGDFLALTLARQVAEILNLAVRNDLVSTIAAAIKADIKDTRLSAEDVAARITEAASEDRRKGVSITRFYFADMRWRNGIGAAGKTSAAVERVNRNRESLLAAARSHVAERVRPDGDKRQDSIDPRAKQRVAKGS